MKKHYQTLGLEEGASQEDIKEAYNRLSKELNPANNDNQEFFKEEYAKVQAAYKALYSTSILATEQGARNKKTVANPISKLEDKPTVSIPNLAKSKKNKTYLSALVVVVLVGLVFFYVYSQPKKYNNGQIVFNKELAFVKKTMLPLTGMIKDGVYEGLFVEGKRTGHHKIQYKYLVTGEERKRFEWYQNFAEGEFKENLYHGNWVFYHKNNSIHAQGNYVNGNNEDIGNSGVPTSGREGTWRLWHGNGQLEQEGKYKKGKADGFFRKWYENGELAQEGKYTNGKADGFFRWWHENGQLAQEGQYTNGKADGFFSRWHKNGEINKNTVYYNIIKNGPANFDRVVENRKAAFLKEFPDAILESQYKNINLL